MAYRSLLLVLLLGGIAFADTGYPSTIRVTETDNSPACTIGQIKVSPGSLTCQGQTAIITTGGSGGGSNINGSINNANQYSDAYYSVTGSSNVISGLVPGTSGYVLTTGGPTVPPFWSPKSTPTAISITNVNGTSPILTSVSGTTTTVSFSQTIPQTETIVSSLTVTQGVLSSTLTVTSTSTLAYTTITNSTSGSSSVGNVTRGAFIVAVDAGIPGENPSVHGVDIIANENGNGTDSLNFVEGAQIEGNYSGANGITLEIGARGIGGFGGPVGSVAQNVDGFFGEATSTNGGLVNNAADFYAQTLSQGASTITARYGFYADNPSLIISGTPGTIVNNYGVYVASQTNGSGNNFGIWTNSGRNHFGGTSDFPLGLTASTVTITGLASGQCVQTTTGGLLTVSGSPCGSGGGSGSSPLGVNYNGVSITSPTAQINFIGPGVSVTATGSTATITISSWPAGGGGSGIVSPGTFTWTNNFGIIVSTLTGNSFQASQTSFSVVGSAGFNIVSSSAGQIAFGEGSASSVLGTASTVDNMWADSTDHSLDFNPNNTSTYTFVGSSATVVAGHCAQFSSKFGIVDAGAGCGVTTSGVASSLGVNFNGVSITSPTAQINFTGTGVSVTAVGSTATVTISNLAYNATNYSSLNAAITAAGNNSVIVIPSGVTETLSTGITLSGTNQTILCLGGGILSNDSGSAAINITGSSITISGCQINENNINNRAIFIVNANQVLLENNYITNSAGIDTIEIQGSSFVSIKHNTIISANSLIEAYNNIKHINVEDNRLDQTGSPTNSVLKAFVNSNSYTLKDVILKDNSIGSYGCFGIEVGDFGGSINPKGIIIDGNYITAKSTSSCGGISVSNADYTNVNNNTFDTNGYPIGVRGIEIIGSHNKVRGNKLFNSSTTVQAVGMDCDGCSYSTFDDNSITGPMLIGTSTSTRQNVIGNIFTHNRIILDGVAAASDAVRLQCNTTNCSVSNNIISENILTGNATSYTGIAAIDFENDASGSGGIMAENIVTGNSISSFTYVWDHGMGTCSKTTLFDNHAASNVSMIGPFGATGITTQIDSSTFVLGGSAGLSGQLLSSKSRSASPSWTNNLFWDSTNSHLGISTGIPSAPLSIGDGIQIWNTAPTNTGPATDNGYMFNNYAAFGAGSFTEVTGQTLSYGINVPQAGLTTSAPGGIFRLDTRGTGDFAVYKSTAGNAGLAGQVRALDLDFLSGDFVINGVAHDAVAKFEVFGPRFTPLSGYQMVSGIYSTDTYGGGVGAGLTLGGAYNSSGATTELAQIAGVKENSTDGNADGSLTLSTRNNSTAAMAEHLRVTAAGAVNIGSSNPGNSAILDVETADSLVGPAAFFGSPSLPDNQRIYYGVGKSWSGTNAVYFGFVRNSTDSQSYATIGHFGADDLFVVQKGGNVGINTTSPAQKLEVNGAVMFDSTTIVGGHIVSTGTTSSVTSCGTSPSIDSTSTDSAGKINVGSGLTTSCTLTFATAYANAPICISSTDSTAISADISSISTTSVTFGFSTSLASGHVWYICVGAKG